MILKHIFLLLAVLHFEIISSRAQAQFQKRLFLKHECLRECKDLEPPMTCQYHFFIEPYVTMGSACQYCKFSRECQCILADGVERIIYTANRMVPGPNIEVCEGDHVIIYVENHIEGSDTTIHWHGIWQNGTQYYDGVPFVTQCPILSGNTFRYEWYASNAGTHFWHSHTGSQKMDGLFGSIIIRQSPSQEKRGYHYDYSEHVIIVNDWFHHLSAENYPAGFQRKNFMIQTPDSILINGKGQTIHPDTGNITETPLEEFLVSQGKKYRFRLINVFGSTCPVLLTIEKHNFTIIASDGEPVKRIVVDGLMSFSAERFDFILHANQEENTYWIKMQAVGVCTRKKLMQLAILRYTRASSFPRTPRPLYDATDPPGLILNQYSKNCLDKQPDAVCFNQMKTTKNVTDSDVLKKNADMKLFLPFGSFFLNEAQLFKPHVYNKFSVLSNGKLAMHNINSISYVSPGSPLISQYYENDPSKFCNEDNLPENCIENCQCTHKIDIPLNAVVELILVDNSTLKGTHHSFHLHGYAFHVIGMGRLNNVSGRDNIEEVRNLENEGLLQRRLKQPALKDTLAVPSDGYAVIRFKANNPGFWLFHCHFMYHIIIGMVLVFQVGQISDLPSVPIDFPYCGKYPYYNYIFNSNIYNR